MGLISCYFCGMFEDRIQTKIEVLLNVCLAHGWTFGFAESCTGGLLSAHVAMQPGMSAVFNGSVVSYAGRVKTDLLNVPTSALKAYGEVSVPVARYMARGARKQLKCDWSVSITGIAGPGGGTLEKPVGTVCFAVSGPAFEEVIQMQFPPSSRGEIQQQSADFALDLLLNAMK